MKVNKFKISAIIFSIGTSIFSTVTFVLLINTINQEINNDNLFLLLTFSFITLTMLFFSIFLISNTFLIEIRGKNLKKTGEKVNAKIIKIEYNRFSNPIPKGKNVPYIIRAEWENPKNNEIIKFRSQYLQNEPQYKEGDLIEVYINKQNPKNYYMNVEE